LRSKNTKNARNNMHIWRLGGYVTWFKITSEISLPRGLKPPKIVAFQTCSQEQNYVTGKSAEKGGKAWTIKTTTQTTSKWLLRATKKVQK